MIPFRAPLIPGWHVERRAEVVQACDHLHITSFSARIATVVGLAGPRGAGKSTVASMVIAREDVRESFPKGVLWLPVGKAARDRLPSLMLDLARMVHEAVLSNSCRPPRTAGGSTEDGVAYITEMVAEGRECLLVVADDVWEVEVLQELKRVGASILFTTRQGSLLPDTPVVQVHEIVKGEAEMVLRRAAGLDETAVLPNDAYELMRRLAVLPEGLTFTSEVAAALLYDGVLPAQDREDLEVAEEAAAILERWSILAREDGGNYRVCSAYSDIIRGCLSETTRDRVLPRWRKYISGVRALLTFQVDDLVEIWGSLDSEEGGDLDWRPYERELEALGLSSPELPKALRAAGTFFWETKDVEGAYTAYSKLLKLQESTNTSDGLIKGKLWTLSALSECANELGRPEEAAELERRSEAFIEENKEGIAEEWDTFLHEEFPGVGCFGDDDDEGEGVSWACCLGDDAAADDSVGKRSSRWCVEDSASERVFFPEGENTHPFMTSFRFI